MKRKAAQTSFRTGFFICLKCLKENELFKYDGFFESKSVENCDRGQHDQFKYVADRVASTLMWCSR